MDMQAFQPGWLPPVIGPIPNPPSATAQQQVTGPGNTTMTVTVATAWKPGYRVMLPAGLVTSALEPLAEPATQLMAGDDPANPSTVQLAFADQASAQAALPAYWQDTPGTPAAAVSDPLRGLAQAKASALATLASNRWNASQSFKYTVAGVSYKLPCDTDAATNVLGSIVGLQLAGSTGPVGWKVADGVFANFALSDLIALGQAMRSHVQGCYINEATIGAAIVAATSTAAVAGVSLNSGWPS